MKISIFGLGYVGCVSVGCLAQNGHQVIGVDVSGYKVDLINNGIPTIVEKDINGLIKENLDKGRIRATMEYVEAVSGSTIALICVGTPNLPTGQLNLEFVFNTARQIGEALKNKKDFFVVAIRSTVLPGTNDKFADIIEQVSGKMRNVDFAIVSNPEFLREGSAVEDYYHPALTVIGADNDKAFAVMEALYREIKAPVVRTDIRVAELIKYVSNAFHALKISFANEVGNISKALAIDAFRVMELLTMDTRLNISPAYLQPGMAYGGSCLPKDMKGLATIAHDHYLATPIISAIENSNNIQKTKVLQLIEKAGSKKIGLFGLAFKKGTDDLRYSPAVELVEMLLGRGYHVKIYDRNVVLSRIMGANKSYIDAHLPHISALLENELDAVIEHAETMVIVHRPAKEEIESLLAKAMKLIDLVRVEELMGKDGYEGICW